MAFAILAIGVLALPELRAQLVNAKIDSLRTQGELITDALAEIATFGDPEPTLLQDRAAAILSSLRLPESERLRLYTREGELLLDSALLSDSVREQALEPRSHPGRFWGLDISPWRPRSLQEEIANAAEGAPTANLRLGADGERVVSVSLPVQRVKAVLAVLTIESNDLDAILARERRARLPFIMGAGVLILLSSTLLALVVANPLRRLAEAADRLRETGGTRLDPPPEIVGRNDEIGYLAQALQRLTAALSERIDSNARFAADVAHEIKNPLTSIRSAVETVRGVREREPRERLLGIIADDVRRLDRLITDISRASRLEAETARGAADRIDLARLLGELAQTYEATRREGANVVYAGAPKGELWVRGQEGPLGQVFRNLIDNARSFSPPGGEVRLSASAAGPRERRVVCVEILDDGPGVPPENLETIFQRFYTQRPQGQAFGANSGLGLSIARQIVEAHKGRIWAENRPEGGARFLVELPLAAEGERRGG